MWRDAELEVTPLPTPVFDSATAAKRLADGFGVASVDAFGEFSRAETSAAAAILAYVERTQIKARPALEAPRRDTAGGVMQIDRATRTNLELTTTLGGERRGSLLATIDRTLTGAGSRLLAARITSPVTDPDIVNARLDAIAYIHERPKLRAALRKALAAAPDIARALSRLSLDRGGPRDLAALRDGLGAADDPAALLALEPDERPAELATAEAALRDVPTEVAEMLGATLADELPLIKRDGGFVRPGADADLDETRALSRESRSVIADLQARYADETGIRNLKIKTQ